MQRRHFLRTTALFSAALTSRLPVIAGPFGSDQRWSGIPEDKKLDPAWIKSLFERGKPSRYRAAFDELKYIGMPVGGMHSGTLYLGGDGRLWLWDIFNDNREGIEPKRVPWDTEVHAGKTIRSRDGAAYVAPATDIRPVEQGFAFRIKSGKQSWFKKMEKSDWKDIEFEATYPVATVRYLDADLPVTTEAEIFSPFVPLNEDQSSLPATIYRFTIRNTGREPVQMDILGWLENKCSHRSPKPEQSRDNATTTEGNYTVLKSSVSPSGSEPDSGSMALASLGKRAKSIARIELPLTSASFESGTAPNQSVPATEQLVGGLMQSLKLAPGKTATVTFIITWHFPNLVLKEIPDKGRWYATRFTDAGAVAGYVCSNISELTRNTLAWKSCWYDSTLPWWFLERTLVNTSCLATTTAHRMATGRYYAWEGVGCCPGTCTHVWQYTQAPGRLFPAMERDIRSKIDLGMALQPDGSMWYRVEADKRPAVDGQAGTILRFYREHLMSKDHTFLREHWPRIRQTISYLMTLDKNGDGMEDTPVENTLDAMWGGEIAWIVGLCIAAVRAGEEMARESGDSAFAETCRAFVEKGRRNMESHLFNGEYFIHRPDAATGRQKIGSYNTCHIDQVYGQAWAHQVGLGRILDEAKTKSALRALWKYNFTPDVGPYIKDHLGGRPYALAGEGGMIMNSNPASEPRPYGDEVTWQMGYFHECMSGFEHQVAAHMMAEGMVEESIVLTRMIHDRYHASKRNPFNEIECSDHYARAMASYGTFISACGFHYHGPEGYLRFRPAISPDDFRAPFTTAEAWGTFEQQRTKEKFTAVIEIRYGKLQLRTWSLANPGKENLSIAAELRSGDGHLEKVEMKIQVENDSLIVQFTNGIELDRSNKLTITVS